MIIVHMNAVSAHFKKCIYWQHFRIHTFNVKDPFQNTFHCSYSIKVHNFYTIVKYTKGQINVQWNFFFFKTTNAKTRRM